MASINRSLRLCPWDKYSHFNWNESFICPKIYFAWLKLTLWSRKACFCNDDLLTFSLAVNAQCQSNMASMKQILRSCPWKNYDCNLNGSFKRQKYILLAWNLRFYTENLPYNFELWIFCLQSALDASQTWLQSTKYCAHVCWKIIKILT